MEDFKTSKINGAMLKMYRLDKAQGTLNEISNNLLAYNTDYGRFNFELKFSLTDSIYMECKSKMQEDEIKEMEDMRDAIQKFLQENPIIEKRSNQIRKHEVKYNVNHMNFKILNKFLFAYESRARHYIDKYGMDTMYEDYEAIDEY